MRAVSSLSAARLHPRIMDDDRIPTFRNCPTLLDRFDVVEL